MSPNGEVSQLSTAPDVSVVRQICHILVGGLRVPQVLFSWEAWLLFPAKVAVLQTRTLHSQTWCILQ